MHVVIKYHVQNNAYDFEITKVVVTKLSWSNYLTTDSYNYYGNVREYFQFILNYPTNTYCQLIADNNYKHKFVATLHEILTLLLFFLRFRSLRFSRRRSSSRRRPCSRLFLRRRTTRLLEPIDWSTCWPRSWCPGTEETLGLMTCHTPAVIPSYSSLHSLHV